MISINKRLEKGEITKITAESLKKEAASYHARKIEKRVQEQEQLLQLLIQDKTNGKIMSSDGFLRDDDENTFSLGRTSFKISFNNKNKRKDSIKAARRFHKMNKNRRTTTQFIFAAGVNNVLVNGKINSLEDSEYKFWQSHFYKIGWTWKRRFTKEPSKLYFKYGVSFLWNNLRLKENKIHVKDGGLIRSELFTSHLKESRLRHVQMNFPMHLEWDFSKNKKYKDNLVVDQTNKSVRIGVGGFVGFKLGTRQYLEYKNIQGVDVEEVQKNNFNMNTFNYGLSTYVGYKSTSLYVKYDLNPLFKNTEIKNISLGIRFDFD